MKYFHCHCQMNMGWTGLIKIPIELLVKTVDFTGLKLLLITLITETCFQTLKT